MPGFVTDASATLPWCFGEEATPWTEGLLDRLQGGEEVCVPAHWPTEVMNGLIMAVRRKRIGLDRVMRWHDIVKSLYRAGYDSRNAPETRYLGGLEP